MTPINWDSRLEHYINAEMEASKYNFADLNQKELFINALVDSYKAHKLHSPNYNVQFMEGKPIVIDGRVQRRYNNA